MSAAGGAAGSAAFNGTQFFKQMSTGAFIKMTWPVFGAAITGMLMKRMFDNATSAGQGLTDFSKLSSGKFVHGPGGGLITQGEDAKRYRDLEAAIAAASREADAAAKATKLVSGEDRILVSTLKSVSEMTGYAEKDLKALGYSLEGLAAQAKAGAQAVAGSILMLSATGNREAITSLDQQIVSYKRMIDVMKFEGRLDKTGMSMSDKQEAAKEFNRLLLAARYGVLQNPDGTPRIQVAPGGVAPEIQAYASLRERQEKEKELKKLMKELGLGKSVTNFNGPVYVDIDARDQDPDKIMFGAIDNLEQMANRPVTSRMHQPFGGGR
jgi:hypothetical protein